MNAPCTGLLIVVTDNVLWVVDCTTQLCGHAVRSFALCQQSARKRTDIWGSVQE